MCSLLTAHFCSNLRPGTTENGPSTKLGRRFGAQRTTRRKKAARRSGVNVVRRIATVRASASGESRREHKNGLDVKRDDMARFQWQWHEDQDGSFGNWNHSSSSFDSDIAPHFMPVSSEVWDCYNVAPQAPNDSNGEMSFEESSPLSETRSAMTPEQEFLSYAMKVPRSQFNGIDLMNSRDTKGFNDAKEVYVLLFGVGEAATEGIYSLRSHCHETGLHHETIICFESSEDAARFSGLLEASMPHVSTVHTIKSSELIQFCSNSGYDCRLELEGSTLMPPEFNVGITDWERSMKLRQGQYQVLDEEPLFTDYSANHETQSSDDNTQTDDDYYSSLVEDDLQDGITSNIDDIRAMLEHLLPED